MPKLPGFLPAGPIVTSALVAGALATFLVPSLATAKPRHHHRTHASRHVPAYGYAPAYARGPAYGYARRGYAYGAYGPTSADPYPPSAADNPYNPYAAPGAALRALARQNQNAPGVTNELAPDNIATATGGPSGGVPGFSGH